jgi:hypothetical protein
MTLEDKIFCLEKTPLPQPLVDKLIEAKEAYEQDRLYYAALLVFGILYECDKQEIIMHVPANYIYEMVTA